MNFKLNTLVAAILLVAAGTANASINNGQATGNLPGTVNNAVDGAGELFVVVTDISKGFSFVGDLGVGMNSFLGASNTSNSWSMGNFTSWAPFVSTIARSSPPSASGTVRPCSAKRSCKGSTSAGCKAFVQVSDHRDLARRQAAAELAGDVAEIRCQAQHLPASGSATLGSLRRERHRGLRYAGQACHIVTSS